MTVSPIASQKCMSAADSAAADSGAGFYTDCRAVRFEGGQRAEGRGWRARQAKRSRGESCRARLRDRWPQMVEDRRRQGQSRGGGRQPTETSERSL